MFDSNNIAATPQDNYTLLHAALASGDLVVYLEHKELWGLRGKVRRGFAANVQLDPEVGGAYPARWIGKVTVTTTQGRQYHGRVDEPKGDPGNTLTRSEIEEKFLGLAA